MRILIWQDYGSIRVYELDTEEKVEAVRQQIVKVACRIGLEFNSESALPILIRDINSEASGGDVESFEYLSISSTI
jgi:hypothetical protein